MGEENVAKDCQGGLGHGLYNTKLHSSHVLSTIARSLPTMVTEPKSPSDGTGNKDHDTGRAGPVISII